MNDDLDAFHLPDSILGLHSEGFYGAIGRIVCVCAVLEGNVTTLRQTLEGAQQGMYTQQPVNRQIHSARRLARELGEPDRAVITDFLDRANDVFRFRNDLVHSSFPAQANGRIWGHRPTRDKAILDGTTDTIDTTVDELRQFIHDLGILIRDFNGVHTIASSRG